MTLRGDAGLRIKKCISIYHFQTKKLKILLVRGLAPLQASSPYNMLAWKWDYACECTPYCKNTGYAYIQQIPEAHVALQLMQ